MKMADTVFFKVIIKDEETRVIRPWMFLNGSLFKFLAHTAQLDEFSQASLTETHIFKSSA